MTLLLPYYIMPKINFTITTPDGTLFKEEVDQISLTTSQGEITILPNHIPLVSDIAAGEARITKDGRQQPFALYGGFIEVRPKNEVVVLADAGERPEHIDMEAAVAAEDRAKKALAETFDPGAYEDAALALEREQARIRVARKYRARGFRTSGQRGE